jgi:hypothetical protein
MGNISNTRLSGLAVGVKRAALSPQSRKLVITLAGVLAVVFIFVSSNVAANHEPKPHGLPVGVVGPPQLVSATARQLDRRAPGAFQILGYRSPAAARTAILHRSVFGAFDPGPPSLLIADAASVPVATLLQDTFTAAARARGAPLIVRDLVPLPPTDPDGGTAFSATLSLIIAGVLGSSMLYLVTRGRALAVHLLAVLALGVGAGLLTALATNVVVGAFTGHFLAIWGVAALFVLALALPIAFFQRLLGLPGTGVGLLVFIVVGDPSSGGATAPQLLPDPWRAISQALPPGAAVTAMRDVVYFHGYGATRALIVLGSYAALGAILAIIADRIRTGAPAATSVASGADHPNQVSAQPLQGVAPGPPAPSGSFTTTEAMPWQRHQQKADRDTPPLAAARAAIGGPPCPALGKSCGGR